ncbi:MAG: hypothetical protein B6U68_04005 [Candidatus Aenigmarchaeota archaeon ex4484_14]|nr:MAG: hypothetical protein B6U68_04005 [Candidatus Aenigmarchaeota archaeon ex4484_14]
MDFMEKLVDMAHDDILGISDKDEKKLKKTLKGETLDFYDFMKEQLFVIFKHNPSLARKIAVDLGERNKFLGYVIKEYKMIKRLC